MKRKYYTGIKLAMAVLSCWVAGLGQIQGQGADREKHSIGIRLKPGEAVTVYGDAGDKRDPDKIYTLTSAFYVIKMDNVDSTTSTRYVKIHLPGPLPSDSQRNKYSEQLADSQTASRGLTSLDWGKDFWIEEKELDSDANWYRFIPEYRYSYFSIGILSVPFKYRFSYKSPEHQLGAESSIGLSMAVDFYRSKTFDERFSAVIGAGLTSINPNSVFDDSTSAKAKNIPGMTVCFGVLGFIQRAQVGIIYGYDFADSDWTFDRKPWVAISFGYAFFNPDAEGKGNGKK